MTLTAPNFAALTGTYTLDPGHTRIGFVARHAMVTKVRGSFNEFEGIVVIDGLDPASSSAQITIKSASIDTRNAQRDEHLRTNDFFAMEEYPEITFVSTAVRPVSEERFELVGDLTIKGVTNSVTIPFDYEGSARDPFANVRLGGTVDQTVFPARHAGVKSGGMGTVSDDIGWHERLNHREQHVGAAVVAGAGGGGHDGRPGA